MSKNLLFLAGLCALATGCSSTKTTEPAEKKETVQSEQYVQQNSLGSWVPRRVKKSQAATEKDDSAERRTLEQMRQDQLIKNMPRDKPAGG